MATLKATVMLERGMLALYVGDRRRAAELGWECLRLFRAANDRWGSAAALVVATAWEPTRRHSWRKPWRWHARRTMPG